MRYMLLTVCIFAACLSSTYASSKVCQDNKYIKKIATDRSLGQATRKWIITVSNAQSTMRDGKKMEHEGNDEVKVSINQDRAGIHQERGRALYVLATNAMNNGYKVRLVDNFGTNCASIDEIDIFRMP